MYKNLSDVVSVQRHFLRSVRIDMDFGRVDAIEGYILQASAKHLLEITGNHLSLTQQRAFTWTGPYGGGKSLLALTLASLAGGSKETRKIASKTLGDINQGIKQFFDSDKPWIVIPIVGKRAPIEVQIASSLDHVCNESKIFQDSEQPVIARLLDLAENTSENAGVLLIIDELGKSLEHAAYTGEDIGFYQTLAEAAARCKGNLVVIGVLHQSFEQYASRLGFAAQQDWAKVQGRYVDIPLVAGTDETVSLIGQAINTNLDHPNSSQTADQIAKVILKRRPSAAPNIAQLLDSCWPLHPVTAAMLGPASKKKFGQNERSVFSFLASAEPLGFSEVIKGINSKDSTYYWPHQFWDYLQVNFEPAILASVDGHRWSLSVDAIERAEAIFSTLHVNLVKTVALIEILRNGSGLAAENQLLTYCIHTLTEDQTKEALSELALASILIFRKHTDSWAVYAGSDFDIEAAVHEALLTIGVPDLSKIRNFLELSPITARKHYWETGAMRWLSRSIFLEPDAVKNIERFNASGSSCGEFMLVIPNVIENKNNQFVLEEKVAKTATKKGILIGVPKNGEIIFRLLEELTALHFVRDNSLKLHSDSVAMREVTARIQAVKIALADELRQAFNDAQWSWNDVVNSGGLSRIASEIADHTYKHSPKVISELVNRNALSTSAVKAQKDLLRAMLLNSHLENLGFDTMSAAAGLYRTTIKALGIHREIDGIWNIFEPKESPNSSSAIQLWNSTKKLVQRSKNLIKLSDLYDVWSKPPYGVKNGLLPIFALSFYLANKQHLAVYTDGMFSPDLTEASLDEWLQDPRRISWRYVELQSSEKQILTQLARSLTEQLKRPIDTDPLDSARALVSIVYGIPAWTRRTDKLTKETKTIRNLLLHASDPHKVLFVDIPTALNSTDAHFITSKISMITAELVNAFELRLRDIERNLFIALDQDLDLESLNHRGSIVSGVGADFKLEAFATRLSTYTGKIEEIESLLMLATSKSSKDWTDHDLDAGEVQLLSWSSAFRRLEVLANLRERAPTRRAIGVVFGNKKTITGSFDVSEKDTLKIQLLSEQLLKSLDNGDYKREIFLAALVEAGTKVIQELKQVDEVTS
ncbi:ATP-binding protein [Aquirhabdus parva]|uniref:ATP-binding protein n=1 Tax=Aquirhabdus parva TaxID=2283318 RepID=A0A345P2Z4_9GAMM|nr:ATP-binding protein [Aquirhabdus parva]AXI01653.1 ATP-binding protein [Aquirhabdus parva]